MDRRYLVEESQPFGVVHEMRIMPGTPCDYGYEKKSTGPETVRFDNGYDHAPSLANQAPNAMAYANRNLDNCFAWTGKPERGI
jgi:hypothetical protein